MGAEEAKPAADAGAEAAEFIGRGTAGDRVEESAQVAVAEASRGEFAAGDGLKQGQVIGIAEAEGAETPAVVEDRTGDGVEETGAWGCVVDDGEGREVSVVRALSQLRQAMKRLGHKGCQRVRSACATLDLTSKGRGVEDPWVLIDRILIALADRRGLDMLIAA